ncbi:MAG: phage tail assembly protein, partial [Phenylobacterium sp.]|nr:phage tail assembly protein [Phenylobacterium sp.]
SPLVTAAGETVTHLHLREPTGDEWEQMCRWPEATRRRHAIELITAIPKGDLGKVGIGDLVRAEVYLGSFFDIGQVLGLSAPRSSPAPTDGLPTSSDG